MQTEPLSQTRIFCRLCPLRHIHNTLQPVQCFCVRRGGAFLRGGINVDFKRLCWGYCACDHRFMSRLCCATGTVGGHVAALYHQSDCGEGCAARIGQHGRRPARQNPAARPSLCGCRNFQNARRADYSSRVQKPGGGADRWRFQQHQS